MSPSREASMEDSSRDPMKKALMDIAAATIDAIEHGSYLRYDLKSPLAASKQNTRYYAPESLLSTWASGSQPEQDPARISLLEISTLEGARLLANDHTGVTPRPKIGVLNFASAKRPGGGFLKGSKAQEESIARSSTLYPTLMTRVAQEFYTLHNRDQKKGYYSHAMIYSPGVLVFRDDQGGWLEPLAIDVLTSAAVNAGVVRSFKGSDAGPAEEEKIAKAMKERMGRILYLFESQGVRHIVLGSFGTGVFRNNVETVASIWAELLLEESSRFRKSFDRIVFAVLGRETFEKFEDVFSRYP
ncbi:uncharacterized protein PHACADRAFT_260111 [Phanerochaete carnosa HHB-10118-sp]|uniref:Microbial-type PARG catalytic domain-containing protein n=1 Tax=Phanerochaete carnosa (strain HHB-10118-sp) TaxID=650164 RepID=K5W3X3_PHACS|nr:uncharacterized protein PHACADRAFT_260111 [Phanerochaete carnosa HHB-10118-sp]EKM53644.1 hypothetical protein PHACADRAFT_260111 [Phanerochaete carnosa HHB-10118-sp]